MNELHILGVVGGGAIGWAWASLLRMKTSPPLFAGEGFSSMAMIVVGALLLTRAVINA